MNTMSVKWIFGLAIALAAAPAAWPQHVVPEPGARLITVDVTVLNRGNVVPDLLQSDFRILDDGKERPIAYFDEHKGEIAMVTGELPMGVASNKIADDGTASGAATIILYDKINSYSEDQAFIRKQLLRLFAGLKPDQRLGLYYLDFNLHWVYNYSDDSTALAKVAQRQLEEHPTTDGLTAPEIALYARLAEALTPMQPIQQQARRNITYPAFRALARNEAGIPGAKNLMWITSQFPLTYGYATERRRMDQAELQMFTNNLTNHNITLYPVDPRGEGACLNTTISPNDRFGNQEGNLIATETPLDGSTQQPALATNQANSLLGCQSLLLLANHTGGHTYRNLFNIEPSLREVVDRENLIYTLGYWAPAETLDDTVHSLKVELLPSADIPDAKLLYHNEYLAYKLGSEAANDELANNDELMGSPIAATQIGMLAVAVQHPDKQDNYRVDVKVSPGDLVFRKENDKLLDEVELALGIEGAEGGFTEKFPIALTEEEYQQAQQTGLNLTTYVTTLAAGAHVRVVAREQSTGRAGSVSVVLP